ncbi:hypothetical protein ILYODFUR_013966 [Ilyodon furcidens]|uniref:Uncharacterized protein n=2 Tax=Goodeidae TaxID=28758 RepID=A0ABV0SL08_9TELE
MGNCNPRNGKTNILHTFLLVVESKRFLAEWHDKCIFCVEFWSSGGAASKSCLTARFRKTWMVLNLNLMISKSQLFQVTTFLVTVLVHFQVVLGKLALHSQFAYLALHL